MSVPISLIPLTCTQCSTAVPAAADQIAWACQQCGTGLLLDENQGLIPMTINYANNIPANASGRPFWVVSGQVQIDRSAFGVFGKKTGEAQSFWETPRQFYIPAYSASLDDLVDIGTGMLKHPADLSPGQAATFQPVTQRLEDIQALAEFIVVGYEALRKDKVKKIEFALKLETPELWILP